MEGGWGQNYLNGMLEILLYQHSQFVQVKVTTRIAANEIAVFETIFAYVTK